MFYFLKLGGSLVTDKNNPHTPKMETINRLAAEIMRARLKHPELKLVLGHGSGSFGHMPAARYHTRNGVHTSAEWLGFVEVWREARALNQIVLDALLDTGLPVISFPPSALAITDRGSIKSWDISPLKTALIQGQIPLVYGDVVYDISLGGTILSTEEAFVHLARHLNPGRVLLAGLEAGVCSDLPECKNIIPEITPANIQKIAPWLTGSSAVDVTGGMAEKVKQMLSIVNQNHTTDALIFSGETQGQVESALLGELAGTRIYFKEV
jgi:isopentenyl phosphate kinase